MKIYLDNSATTSIHPDVLDLVVSVLQNYLGNPSSAHHFGQESRKRLLQARQVVANYLGIKLHETIFTSGGTESINLIIRGLLEGKQQGHILTSSVEHASVYSTVKLMENSGHTATYLSPGLWGAIKPEAVRAAIQPNTQLIALMAVNNETGVKTDIPAIAAIAEEAKIPFLVDGVALLGKEVFTIPTGVSAMAFSGHKFHAPAGTGIAFIRSSLKLRPLISGGDQEFSRRGGTENLSGIIGMAEAIRLLNDLPSFSQRMSQLRDKLEKTLIQQLSEVYVNGEGPRIGNISNLAFAGIEGEVLLTTLDMEGIAVSHGSACSSGALEPSRILLNMGLPMERARSSIRFSLSRFTTEEEIDRCLSIVIRTVRRLRDISNS